MDENLIIGVDGREGGLDAAAAVARWQERHPEAGAFGTR
jgi:hypothetical protein